MGRWTSSSENDFRFEFDDLEPHWQWWLGRDYQFEFAKLAKKVEKNNFFSSWHLFNAHSLTSELMKSKISKKESFFTLEILKARTFGFVSEKSNSSNGREKVQMIFSSANLNLRTFARAKKMSYVISGFIFWTSNLLWRCFRFLFIFNLINCFSASSF